MIWRSISLEMDVISTGPDLSERQRQILIRVVEEYVATGFTCNNTRTALANWGTRVSRVVP